MYVVYRSSATRDEEPPCSQLTAGRYSIVYYYISRYPITILTSTFSATAYLPINNMKDKKQEKNIIQTKKMKTEAAICDLKLGWVFPRMWKKRL